MNMLKGLIQVYRNIVTENLTGDDLMDAFDTADICEVELAAKDAVIEAAKKVKAELDVIRKHLDRAPLHVHIDAHNELSAALEQVQKAEER